MVEVATIEVVGRIGVLTIDSPPVNALGIATRQGLQKGLTALCNDDLVKAIVLICAGRTFFAGADIREFGKPRVSPVLSEIFELMENGGKSIVAAIHGNALGGGLELALVCDYRIAVASAMLGLPEVNLGLLPGAGGTQRLTRIVGAEAALDMITSGRPVSGEQALSLGVIDALAQEGQLKTDAIAFAESIVGKSAVRVRDREGKIVEARAKPELFTDFRKKHASKFRGLMAPESIIKAIEAAVQLPFDEGLKCEHQLFLELESSLQSKAMRHVFMAERSTAKIPDISPETSIRTVNTIGVIGAGTMGRGIAINFLDRGMSVTLVEMNSEALANGMAAIQRHYEAAVRKGRIGADEAGRRVGLISPTIELESLADIDLLIEAAYEEMAVKKDIFYRLDAVAKPQAILASNTSYLDLDEIAAATQRPGSVVGLHFFSPANVMRLLEVVRGRNTAPDVLATAIHLAKKIGKVPVVSKVCHGFIVNRIMSQRSKQAESIILEGPTPAQVDAALVNYGFAMGPFQMIDLVGLDVLTRGQKTRSIRSDLVALGRLGQKTGSGFYDYDEERHPSESPIAQKAIADYASFAGTAQTGPRSEAEILERLLFPVVNEGAKLIEEGIALRVSDIDTAAILGYNWPAHTGGPMFWADTIGIAKIVQSLRQFEMQFGPQFKPAELLESMAAEGRTFVGQ